MTIKNFLKAKPISKITKSNFSTFFSNNSKSYFSVQSFLFVQRWFGIFFVQSQGNLCDVGAELAATSSKWKLPKGDVVQTTMHYFFFYAVLSEVPWATNIAHGLYLCNIVPKVVFRQHWTIFFMCNVLWCFLDDIAQGF